MATRRTRLKGRKTPQSTGKQVKRQSATAQARKQNAATPTGPARTSKRLPGKASSRQTAKLKLEVQQITPARPKKTKAPTNANRKNMPKDEYEFDETDDFISENFLSTSFSACAKKPPRKSVLPNVKSSSNKDNLVNQQKGKGKNAQTRCARPEGNKKKTSTPLSEVTNSVAKGQQRKSQRKHQRYLQVSVPKLDFDVSVTPILPISADQTPTTRSSLRQEARRSSDAKSVSFENDLIESIPSQTPAGKINRKKAQRQTVVVPGTSTSSFLGDFKEPAPILPSASEPVSRKGDRKRKRPDTNNSTKSNKTAAASTTAKRQKTDLPQTKPSLLTSKKGTLPPKKNVSSQKKSAKKRTSTKQAELSFGSLTQIRDYLHRRKPVTSTPLVGQAEEAAQSPPVYDSGISMGENLSVSGETSSSAALTLPGFMEDEPMQSSMDFLDSLPLSAPSGSSANEVPASHKSAAREYKPTKAKRERGRYSTSRVEAWAKAANESLQDVESFELVVE